MNIDPDQTPKLSPEQAAALLTLFQRTLQIGADNLGMNKTCLSCFYFQEGPDFCAKWNAKPPARTIVEACPAYDPTPF